MKPHADIDNLLYGALSFVMFALACYGAYAATRDAAVWLGSL